MLSVILPVKDEPYLPTLLNKMKNTLKLDYEILVQTEEGLGSAVRKGFEKAKGEKIIILDSDGSHNVEDIPRFIKELDTHLMVIGSRYVEDGRDKRNLFRRIVSIVLTIIIRLKFNNMIKDPLSGFFGFRKEILDDIELKTNGFKVGLEVMMKTKARVKEIPIILERRKSGSSKAGFKELIELARLCM